MASLSVDGTIRGQSSATYHTSQGTYFVFRAASNQVKAYKVTATSPPTIVSVWSVTQNGQGSPWVTTTDGTNNAIVWVVGAQGDNRLHGYNGDTGTEIYAGGGANELMSGTRKWNSGIVARGSIYVANDNKVYAFRVPGGTPTPTLSIAYTYTNGHRDWHANIDPNCHGNCESDSDSQTNAHSETPCDTEGAANSGAKAGRGVTGFCLRLAVILSGAQRSSRIPSRCRSALPRDSSTSLGMTMRLTPRTSLKIHANH